MKQFEHIANATNAGVRPYPEIHPFVSHAAIVEGLVYSVDLTTATAANHGIATTLKTDEGGAVEGAIQVIAMEAATGAGKLVRCMVSGYVDATADATGVGAEAFLSSDGAGKLTVAAANEVVIGRAPEAIGANATGKIWFFGGLSILKGA